MVLKARLERLLGEAIRLDKASKGNIQAFDFHTQTLRIVSQQGFDRQFLRHFRAVRPFDPSACGRAFGSGGCITIPDVLLDEGFRPHREIAIANGFRSVKSLAVTDEDGRLYGVLSTHSAQVRWDWERDNTRRVATVIASTLAALPKVRGAGVKVSGR
jgi:GAF domain-containing protein